MVKFVESESCLRSSAPVANPLWWISRLRIVISLVAYASYILNSGIYTVTLSSYFILPSSTKMPNAAAVKALVLEAILNKVFEFVFSLIITEFTPKPFLYTSFPSLIIPIANPETLNNRRSFVARLSTWSLFKPCPKQRFKLLPANSIISVKLCNLSICINCWWPLNWIQE